MHSTARTLMKTASVYCSENAWIVGAIALLARGGADSSVSAAFLALGERARTSRPQHSILARTHTLRMGQSMLTD
jgi:hypothetical protein